ncbi:MAG: hypothetical protein QXT79_06905 [Thermofilaceae archaeon]
MEKVEKVLGNGLPLVATGGGEETGTDFLVRCWWTYRASTRPFLIHKSLDGKKLVNVRVEGERDVKILPDGKYAILVLEGRYQSKGKWATEYFGYYFSKIYEHPALRVLDFRRTYSGGGGQGGVIAVIALDLDLLQEPIPIAKINVRLSSTEEGYRILFTNGSSVPFTEEIEKMIVERGKSEKRGEEEVVVYRRTLRTFLAHGSIVPLPPAFGQGWVYIGEEGIVFSKSLVALFNKLIEMRVIKTVEARRFNEWEYEKAAASVILPGNWLENEPNLRLTEVSENDLYAFLKGEKTIKEIRGQ